VRPVRWISALAVLAGVLVTSATASAPPVGPLPKGPVASISVVRGEVFGIALPRAGGGGRVWRVARPYESKVVAQVSEGVQDGRVVAVYRAVRPGKTAVVYALTVGERTKALKARTFKIVVR
jgi:hypothetical protein